MSALTLAAGDIENSDLIQFWTALAVLLIAARGLGLVAKRLGQPAVIGELTAGIVLGPTLLGRVAPEVGTWLFQGEVSSVMIGTVSWLGVVLLLAITGFETDLGLLRRLGKAATWTSITSLVIPFGTGLLLASQLPDAFRGEEQGPAFTLFMGVALAISALPVVAKVLREMGVIARPIGQVTLAAGMVNDLVGWVLLGLVAGLAGTGSVDAGALAFTVFGLVVFLGLAVSVGQRAVDTVLRSTAQRDASNGTTVGVALTVVVVLGAITQALGVEAVLGAFVAGILLSRSPLGGHRLENQVSAVTDGFLAPIFFATAGLRVDLGSVFRADVWPWALAVIAVATISKVIGGVSGGLLGGMRPLEGLAIGVGLNARGALEIVVATIGLGLGVLSPTAYSVIVVMAVVTSMMAPPLLSLIIPRLNRADELGQDSRLAMPGDYEPTAVLRARTALLPTRGGASSVLAGQLLDGVLPHDTRITAFTVHPPELGAGAGRDAAREVSKSVSRRLAWRDRVGTDSAAAIMREAVLGYDVIAVGASAEGNGSPISPVLSRILKASSVPVLIVRGSAEDLGVPLEAITAAVDGTPVCDAARDVAASLATARSIPLNLVHVSTELSSRRRVRVAVGADPDDTPSRGIDRVELVGRAAQQRAMALGAETDLDLRSGNDVAVGILQSAEDTGSGLIVIGAQIRTTADGVSLGRTVEQVLDASPCVVLVVALP